MTAEELVWESLSDFSAGIFSTTNRQGGQSGPYPKGAAQETNTYRCLPLPGGGIGPGPRKTKTYARASFDPVGNMTDGGVQYVTGFQMGGPVLPKTGAIGSQPEMFFSVEYLYNNGGTTQRRYRLWRHRGFEGTPTEDFLKLFDSTEPSPAAAYRMTTFAQTRSNKATPLNPGIPVIVAAWYAGGGGYEKFICTFPNDATPTSATVYDVNTTLRTQVMAHQGRIVAFQRTGYDHGPNAEWSTNEDVHYAAVNNATALITSPAAVFSYERASGYGDWSTMSANELLLLKVYGGALTVNGDLANPTIVNLPNVTSTGGVTSAGCHSPLGYCYTSTQSGLWVWNGGDTSEFLSPQLRGDFWHTEAVSKFLDQRGIWASWGDLVIGPNNWVLDTVRKGWWRLEDPALVTCWAFQASPGGEEMWGAIVKYASAATPIAHGWDRTLGAQTYSWQGHHIGYTTDRLVNVRELVLVVQGSGSVTVTLSSDLGTQVETFAGLVNVNAPVTIRRNTKLTGARVAVRIEANGGSQPAPIVYELRVGMAERMKVGSPNA